MNRMFFRTAALRPFLLPLMAVLMLGAVMASCSKDEALLDAFPAEVDNVGMVRLKGVLTQAGFEFGADGVKGVTVHGRFADLIALTGAIDRSGTCDLDRMAWARDLDGTVYVTALVSDEAKFTEATADEIEWAEAKGGFKQGQWNGFTALAGNGRFWLVDAKDAVKSVGELQKKAAKSPLTALEGVCGVLEGDGLLNMAMRRGASSKGAKADGGEKESLWATLCCNVKDNRLTASSVVMQGDGTTVSADGLQAINPAVLSYIPDSFNFAFAIGLTPDFDWSTLTQAVGTFGGFQARGMMAVATPYLQSVNGTVMLAAGPANDQAYSDVDPGNWHFVLMAHLPQQKISEIMNMVRSSMFMAGISPRVTDDGLMVVPQYGMNLYIGNVDGYFAVSNMPFDSSRQNSLAPLFTGKDGALSLELPSLRSLNPSAPAFGLKLTGQTGEGTTTAELVLTGTSQPILQAILSVLL
ncbi:MAG: hypothetical protein K2F88_00580 [Duncaniella sp.]|nr:hypothetical protein [Duncaniella sp.]